MNTQEIFNKVAIHLIKQSERSFGLFGDAKQCAYRGVGGLMCAVGCLIADEHYDSGMETSLLYNGSDPHVAVTKSIGRELSEQEVSMLAELQNVHDKKPVIAWPDHLRKVASQFSLSIPPEIQE